jgi:hypothetical protein
LHIDSIAWGTACEAGGVHPELSESPRSQWHQDGIWWQHRTDHTSTVPCGSPAADGEAGQGRAGSPGAASLSWRPAPGSARRRQTGKPGRPARGRRVERQGTQPPPPGAEPGTKSAPTPPAGKSRPGTTARSAAPPPPPGLRGCRDARLGRAPRGPRAGCPPVGLSGARTHQTEPTPAPRLADRAAPAPCRPQPARGSSPCPQSAPPPHPPRAVPPSSPPHAPSALRVGGRARAARGSTY